MDSTIKNFAMPLVFLGALLFSLFFCSVIPFEIKSFLYAISLSIKELLIFSLPFVIFSLVFSSITKLGSKAIKYIVIIIPLICFSNFTNTILSYFASSGIVNFGLNIDAINDSQDALKLIPYFDFSIKKILSNDIALLSGVISGLILGIFRNETASRLSDKLNVFTKYFFKILVPIMPFFIVGTALKLQHDGILASICSKYLPILFVFIVSAYGFVTFQFFVLSKFKVSKVAEYLKNIFPAVVTAFGSMSSAAALPISIKAAEKNLENKNNAGIIVPSTVNIHLVGDCFFIPMIALAVMTSFGMEFPSLGKYIIFSLHFVLAKFAVAAVPGGGVLVMLPVMQNYLGLSSDMLAIVTALYILFDPIITACNVCGNGALAIVFDKLTRLRFKSA